MANDEATGVWRAIRLAARVAFVAGLLCVTTLSLTGTVPGALASVWDKLQHGLAYFALMIAGAAGFPDRRVRLALAAGLVLWGGVLEMLQAAIPQRSAEIADVIANAAGVLVAGATARLGGAATALAARLRRRP